MKMTGMVLALENNGLWDLSFLTPYLQRISPTHRDYFELLAPIDSFGQYW